MERKRNPGNDDEAVTTISGFLFVSAGLHFLKGALKAISLPTPSSEGKSFYAAPLSFLVHSL
jgi:hypothetical protein